MKHSFIDTMYIVLFVLIVVLIILINTKPSFIFKENGRPREFGVGYDSNYDCKTLYDIKTIVFITVLVTIICIKHKM